MADNLMTKVWALDFGAHRWSNGNGANDPDQMARFSSSSVKFVALAIARASLRNGACWASQKTLANDTGVSKQTVSRVIGELEAAGWLKRIGRQREDGGKSTDKLWLTLPQVVLDAETVPPRPHRFYSGVADTVDHDETPGNEAGQLVPPAGGPPLKESRQEGINRKDKNKSFVGLASDQIAKASPPEDISAAAAVLWKAASKTGRERSSKAELEKALRAARGRGHALERIMRGMGAYFRSHDATRDGGVVQRGVHRMLENDRWESFVDDAESRAAAGEVVTPAQQAAVAEMGTLEQPSEKRQRLWCELFNQGMAWDPDRGPQPGRMGCRVSDAIQLEFGIEPFARRASEDSAAFD